VEVVGRRWSQAGGGAPRAPNNGGAAALWWSRRSGVPAVLYAAEQDGLRSVNSSTRPRHGHDMEVCVRGVRRRRRWAGGGTVGSAWPRRVRRVAQGEWGRKVVRHQRVPRRADRRTKAGLGRRVRRAAVGRRSVPARRRVRSRSRGKMFGTSPVQLRFSQDF
jgi:hypothetical protein